jgi:hypothetical protein
MTRRHRPQILPLCWHSTTLEYVRAVLNKEAMMCLIQSEAFVVNATGMVSPMARSLLSRQAGSNDWKKNLASDLGRTDGNYSIIRFNSMKTENLALGVTPSQMDHVYDTKAVLQEDNFGLGKQLTARPSNTKACLERFLGPGPMRFAPATKERKVSSQIRSRSVAERETLDALRKKWAKKVSKKEHLRELLLTDAHILRYARACSFHPKNSWKVLRQFERPVVQRLLSLKAASIEDQLQSQTIFPLPGLQTRQGFDVFYMKPSRFKPMETSMLLITWDM